MSKKKVIGIPGWKPGDNSFGATIMHLEYISQFGIPRIIFPEEDVIELDLLYLPGGPDLSPFTYGQYPGFRTSNPDVFKQFFFDCKLQQYIDNRTPIFGVCLGFQMLCAKFNSQLTQDLPGHPESKARCEKAHDVYSDYIYRGQKFEVNSHHHQGVYLSHLGQDLEPIAIFADTKKEYDTKYKFNIVEGMKHKTLPIGGVQWHPEEFYTQVADSLFEELLSKSQRK
jgi:putative glutamine amidotransferase